MFFFSVFSFRPSETCGPFRGDISFFVVVSSWVNSFSCVTQQALDFFASAGFVIPVLALLLWGHTHLLALFIIFLLHIHVALRVTFCTGLIIRVCIMQYLIIFITFCDFVSFCLLHVTQARDLWRVCALEIKKGKVWAHQETANSGEKEKGSKFIITPRYM